MKYNQLTNHPKTKNFMKNLLVFAAATLVAAMGLGCSDSESSGPAYPENPNVVPVYKNGDNGDLSPVICISDKNHTWYQCVIKNGAATNGGKNFPTYVTGGLWVSGCTWNESGVSGVMNITVENYNADVVGTQADASSPIYFTIFPEGTPIDENMNWVSNPIRVPAQGVVRTPYVWSTQNPEINKGKTGYIVAKFPWQSDAGENYDTYRGWIKVTVDGNGSVRFGGMCVCLGGGEFFTGQMPTVGYNPEPEPEPEPFTGILEVKTGDVDNGFSSIIGTVDNDTFANFALESPDGVWAYGGDKADAWQLGGLWAQRCSWTDGSGIAELNIAVDNYGCPVVGTQANASAPIYFSVLSEGTLIDDNLAWVENSLRDASPETKGYNGGRNYFMTPYIWSGQQAALNKNQSGYIVAKCSYKNSEKNIEFGFYRTWIKVSVNGQGAVTLDGMYLCVGDQEFRTGQTE